MGQYKYKLKEAPGDNLPKVNKNDKYKVGYTTIDNDTKSTITDIDPETGRISWGIKKLPNLEELFNTSTELTQVAKDVYIKAKSDKKLRLIYDEARALRNKIRTHMRNEYPEEYRRVTTNMNEGDLDEMSTTGGGANAASFSGGTGMQYATPYAFRKTKKKQEPIPENIGADLGPGPKASEDGVKDNAYVKQFGYKLVPKKIKGSGIIVKQLFEKEEEEKKKLSIKTNRSI
jgi:ABC-type glycerol-3-phosphate transport system substrate-binding protein